MELHKQLHVLIKYRPYRLTTVGLAKSIVCLDIDINLQLYGLADSGNFRDNSCTPLKTHQCHDLLAPSSCTSSNGCFNNGLFSYCHCWYNLKVQINTAVITFYMVTAVISEVDRHTITIPKCKRCQNVC